MARTIAHCKNLICIREKNLLCKYYLHYWETQMALPLAPIAFTAVRYGTVLAFAYYLSRRNKGLPTVSEEVAHDDVDEGVSMKHHKTDDARQANVDARLKRAIRFGTNGPGIEIDASALGRFRIKRI